MPLQVPIDADLCARKMPIKVSTTKEARECAVQPLAAMDALEDRVQIRVTREVDHVMHTNSPRVLGRSRTEQRACPACVALDDVSHAVDVVVSKHTRHDDVAVLRVGVDQSSDRHRAESRKHGTRADRGQRALEDHLSVSETETHTADAGAAQRSLSTRSALVFRGFFQDE